MGSDQSSQLPAGAPGSRIKSQRDEDIPYTSYSISKPISGDSPKSSPRNQASRARAISQREGHGKDSTPKHDIVVVADGQTVIKDPDPELTRLGTIPAFYPIMRGSLNVPTSSRDVDLLDKLDHRNLLLLCLRYQEHLKQLGEAVAFDQNALCIRIKETNTHLGSSFTMSSLNHLFKCYIFLCVLYSIQWSNPSVTIGEPL